MGIKNYLFFLPRTTRPPRERVAANAITETILEVPVVGLYLSELEEPVVEVMLLEILDAALSAS